MANMSVWRHLNKGKAKRAPEMSTNGSTLRWLAGCWALRVCIKYDVARALYFFLDVSDNISLTQRLLPAFLFFEYTDKLELCGEKFWTHSVGLVSELEGGVVEKFACNFDYSWNFIYDTDGNLSQRHKFTIFTRRDIKCREWISCNIFSVWHNSFLFAWWMKWYFLMLHTLIIVCWVVVENLE